MNSTYVIACTTDGVNFNFLGIDHNSGGYSYWTSRTEAAEHYKTADDDQMMRQINEILNKKDSVFADGTRAPNVMKHGALGLNILKKQGTGKILVVELKPQVLSTWEIAGELT